MTLNIKHIKEEKSSIFKVIRQKYNLSLIDLFN